LTRLQAADASIEVWGIVTIVIKSLVG